MVTTLQVINTTKKIRKPPILHHTKMWSWVLLSMSYFSWNENLIVNISENEDQKKVYVSWLALLLDMFYTSIHLYERNTECGRKKCRVIEFKVKPNHFVKCRIAVCKWASLFSKSVKKECISAKRTRKHQTLSTPNNLKIKRSFELLSCSERTKK